MSGAEVVISWTLPIRLNLVHGRLRPHVGAGDHHGKAAEDLGGGARGSGCHAVLVALMMAGFCEHPALLLGALCSGSGNFWIGFQGIDSHDYYSNQVTLG